MDTSLYKGCLYIWTSIVLTGNVPYAIAEETGLTALETVAKSNTDFASSMYRVLTEGAEDDQNLIFSPYSISAVMAMVKLGANGTTAVDIRNAMKYPESDETLVKGYKNLLEILQGTDGFTLQTVNKIYGMTGFQIKDTFTTQLKDYFDATLDQLDFCNNRDSSAKEINKFVETVTRNKIKDLISPEDITNETKLVLVNAIYFKGAWKKPFKRKETRDEYFHIRKGQSIKVPMMRMGGRLNFADIPELDSRGDKLWMIIILPNKLHDGLKELEEKLSASNFSLGEIPKRMKDGVHVNLRMPRFKLESTIDLEPPLTKLGAGLIFNETCADFSNIHIPQNKDENLYVSQAVQKAFIEVNEEGSEAAAATRVSFIMVSGASSLPPPPIEFYVDHPFISIIAYKLGSEHEILFMSKMSNPPPSESSSPAYTVTGEELRAVQTVVKANSRVAESLSRVLLQCHPGGNQNLIFSPHSISRVMAMLKLGANGVTGNDIRMAMEYPQNESTLNEGYKHLLQMLKGTQEFALFATVDKMYAITGYRINKNFTSQLKEQFDSGIQQIHFSKEINRSFENMGGIKITSHHHDQFNNSLVLLTGMNIGGSWKYKFDKEGTTKEVFYIERGKRVKVPMMKVKGKFRYSDNPNLGATSVVLPYKDDRYFMTLLLPNEVNGIRKLEAKLFNSKTQLDTLPRNMFHKLVNLKMPRFKLQSTIDLEEPLTKLGLASIFNPRVADFSKILQNNNRTHHNLHVSKVLQKVVIDANEEGSQVTKFNKTPEGIHMNINHPFILVITFNYNTEPECDYVYNLSNNHCEYEILFIGKISSPRESSHPLVVTPLLAPGTLVSGNQGDTTTTTTTTTTGVGKSFYNGYNVIRILTVMTNFLMISWILG